MSMQSVASPASRFTPPKRQFAAAYSGRRGLAGHRPDASISLPTPRARSSGWPRNTARSIAAMCSAKPASALLGPEANELVLFDQNKLFSSTHGWETMLGRLFPRGLMLLDFDEHRLHRRALSVAFKSGPMKSYLGELDAGIAARVAQWKAQPGPMLFYPAMKQLTLDLAATSFLGAGIGPEVDEITRAFVDMVAASVAADPPALAGHADGARRQGPRSASSPISRSRFRSAATRAAKTCSRSCAAPPTRTARCCRPRISSIT